LGFWNSWGSNLSKAVIIIGRGLLQFKNCIHRRGAEVAEKVSLFTSRSDCGFSFAALSAANEKMTRLCVLRVSSEAGGETMKCTGGHFEYASA